MSGNKLILSINVGSSSLKFALYEMGQGGEDIAANLMCQGAALGIGGSHGSFKFEIRHSAPAATETSRQFSGFKEAVETVLNELNKSALPAPSAAGHRIVLGAPERVKPEVITTESLKSLKKDIPFAPLHLPGEIEAIEALAAHFKGKDFPQVACFDSEFHAGMPEVARRYPFPEKLWDSGVRRYGFHGISYEYVMSTLKPLPEKVIIAHLGNGASMAAVKNGRPMETSMGFSPMGGFMMSTRSGDIDPGVLVYLMNEKGYSGADVEKLVNRESGLLGVSGVTSDMKTLLEKESSDPKAALAVEMFCYQIKKTIGAFAAVLGGVDALVFTGGIGERSAAIRQRVCEGLEHLGIKIDKGRNQKNARKLSADGGKCEVMVVPTNEDLMIARKTYRILFGG